MTDLMNPPDAPFALVTGIKRMTRSESTRNLDAALNLAKRNYKPLLKTKENPFFKSKYADLADVLEAIEGPLSAQGLVIIQSCDLETGSLALHTELVHAASGEFRSSFMSVSVTADPQKMASVSTYFRRYAIQTLAGVAADDDDAQVAAKNSNPPPPERPKVSQTPARATTAARPGEKAEKPSEKPADSPTPAADAGSAVSAATNDDPRTDAQKREHNKAIRAISAASDIAKVKAYIIGQLGDDYAGRSFADWENVIGKLQSAHDGNTLNELVGNVGN